MFKIFKDDAIKIEPEKEYFLKLVEHDNGYVSLVACDKYGNIPELGYILRINKHGTVSFYINTDIHIGLQLDFEGSIIKEKITNV